MLLKFSRERGRCQSHSTLLSKWSTCAHLRARSVASICSHKNVCSAALLKKNEMLIVTIMSFICALREKMNTFIKCISYTGSWSYNVKGLWCQGWPLECGDHCVPVLNREGTLSGWFDVVHPPYFIILFVTLPTKQVICFGEKKISVAFMLRYVIILLTYKPGKNC